MNFTHLHYFIIVVQCGSISKASEKLYMDRGNLSTIIAALEKECGVPLLLRTSKGVALTPFGKHFYSFAEQVLQEYAQLKQVFSHELTKHEKSELLIFFPNGLNTISFFEFFNSFNESFPHISLNINETLASTDNDFLPHISFIFEMLPEDLPFIYFFITTKDEPPSLLIESGFMFSLIDKTDVFAYCTEDHIIAQYKTITTNTLQDMPILLYSSSSLGLKPSVSGIPATQINAVSNFSLFKQMLGTGKFVSIGSDRKNAIDMREFVKVPFADNTKFYFYVAIKTRFLQQPTVNAFLHFFFDYENLPFPEIFQVR